MNLNLFEGILFPNRSIKLSDLLKGSAINLPEITQYQFVDINTNSQSGYFLNREQTFSPNEPITILAEELTSTWFRSGSQGRDTLSVRAMNNNGIWSDWQSFSVQVANVPPVVFTSDLYLNPDTRVKISDFFTVSDANNDSISHFRLLLSSVSEDSSIYFDYGGNDLLLPTNQIITIPDVSLPNVKLQLAKRSERSEGNEKVWLSAYDGKSWSEWSAINIYPERLDRPDDANFIGAFHQKASNINGKTIETRIPLNGEPDIWIDEQRVTNDSALEFDPAINEKVDVVYGEFSEDGLSSKIFINGSLLNVEPEPWLNYQIQLTEGNLYYLSVNRRETEIPTLTRYGLDLNSTESNLQKIFLDIVPINYIADENSVTLVGLDTITGEYHVNVYNPQLSENTYNYITNNPVLVSSDSVNRN